MWSNFWKDFNSEHEWRFPELAPWQIQRSFGKMFRIFLCEDRHFFILEEFSLNFTLFVSSPRLVVTAE